MIFDKENMFCEGQAITATAASDNVIDMGQDNTGRGERVELFIQAVEGFAATGEATLTVALQDCDTEGGSFADLQSTSAIPKADLEAGYRVKLSLPAEHRRFLRLNFTVATGPFTSGMITAGLVKDTQTNTASFIAEAAA
jgi:hypothetical protein